MKAYNVDDFAALIGFDWTDKKHALCEHPKNTKQYHYTVIKHKLEALHKWAMDFYAYVVRAVTLSFWLLLVVKAEDFAPVVAHA
jgi:hypothetical protein